MTRAMTFYLSLLPLLLCIVSCGAPDSDDLKPPDWIQGAWRGQNLEVSSNAAKADGELQWIFEHRNGSITKKAHYNSGSQWLSEFDCTEIEKTNAVYSVSVSFSALNENPTEIWRWERATQNTLTFWPLYGRASLKIPMTKETWIEGPPCPIERLCSLGFFQATQMMTQSQAHPIGSRAFGEAKAS